MAYLDQFNLSQDATFQKKVEIAIVKAAIAISNELTTVPSHPSRVALAYQVLGDPARYAAFMAVGVAADPTIDGNSIDSVLQTRVDSIWNSYAISRR